MSVLTGIKDGFREMINDKAHKQVLATVVQDKLFEAGVRVAVSRRAKAVCPTKKKLDEVVMENGATLEKLLRTSLLPSIENAVEVCGVCS